ncbi:hypothetical protein ACLOJK_000424 [Asimina triloba]
MIMLDILYIEQLIEPIEFHVSRSNLDDTEPLYYYYNKNDLGIVLEALKSSNASYSSIKSAISKHWGGLVNVTESKGDSSCRTQSAPSGLEMEMETCVANLSSTFSQSLKQGIVKTIEGVGCKKSEENSAILEDSNLVNCKPSEAIGKHDSASKNQLMDMTGPLEISEGSAEIPQATTCPAVEAQETGITDPMEFNINDSVQIEAPKEVHPAPSPSVINSTKALTSEMLGEPVSYFNFYSFGWLASLVVQELTCKSSNGIKNDPKRSAGEMISSQLKAITKKSMKFCWSGMQKLDLDAQQEKCGWCFSCKHSSDEDCLFNRTENKVSYGSKVGTVGLHSKRNRKSHLFSVKHYILSIEDRLRGLLAGPWEKPHHRKQWRTNIIQAPDVASVKPLLLTVRPMYNLLEKLGKPEESPLELNLRRIALSTEWLKSVDSAVTVGSASHLLITSDHVSSKRGGRKQARKNNSVGTSNFTSTESGTYWWRGGRLSRQVFHWKVLPRSMAFKAGRRGGCRKIPGITYPDGSEFSKRCKCIAWRAAVQMSTCVPQLAYQVRELDANIKWNDILNPQLFFPLAKESKKLAKPLTKVTIRRKCIEGTEVKYLVDFGVRKTVPDIVTKHGVMLEESSNERKKFWLNESYVPLKLLKAYEEKKQAHTSSKASPGLNHPEEESKMKKSTRQKGLAQKQARTSSKASPGLNHHEEESKMKKSARQKGLAQKQAHTSSKASPGLNHHEEESKMKKSARPKGLSHLFSRAERISVYCCGHCNKDVIAREAVSCQICKGFFHREHVRLGESTIEASCTYACFKCQDNKVKIKSLKVRSGGKIIAKRLKVLSGGSDATIKLRAMQSEETKAMTKSPQLQEENDKTASKCRKKQSKKKKTTARSCGDQSGRTAIGVKSYRQQSEKTKATVKSYIVKPELVSIPELRRSQRSVKKASYVPAPVQSTRLSVSKEGNKVQSKRKMPVKPKAGKSDSKGKRTSVPHAYWLQGLLWTRKACDEYGSEFQEKKVLSSSKPSTDTLQQPVCGLCHEQYDLELTYIACESCEDWFHGDAFGISKKNVNNLLGFKCHNCLKKKPPVCPYSTDALVDKVQFHDERNQEEGIVSFKDLSEDENCTHVINAARSPPKDDYLGSCGSEEPVCKKRRTDSNQACKLEEVPSIVGCHECDDKKSVSFEVVGEEGVQTDKEVDGSKDNPVVAGLLDVVTTFSDSAKLCMCAIFFLQATGAGDEDALDEAAAVSSLSALLRFSSTLHHLNQIHSRIILLGLQNNHILATHLLSSFLRFLAVDRAFSIYTHSPQPSPIFSINSILQSLADTPSLQHHALSLYLLHMRKAWRTTRPNRFTFPPLLKACASAFSSSVELTREIHAHVAKLGIDVDVYVGTALVDSYSKHRDADSARRVFNEMPVRSTVTWNSVVFGLANCGEVDAARRLFEEMPERNVVSWTSMISGYARNGYFYETLAVFEDMNLAAVKPNDVTLVSVLSACANLGALSLGRRIHAFLEGNGFTLNLYVGSALIDMYCKCGMVGDALDIFHRMPEVNVVACSAMIMGLAMNGKATEALAIFEDMRMRDMVPNDITFVGVLCACCHAGLVEKGFYYFRYIVREYSIIPKLQHYACMVDLLGRAGYLGQAYRFIMAMPTEPDVVVWGALLGACRIHHKFKLGEYAARRILKLDPKHCGSLVFLSNMHARAGNWAGVRYVQKMMGVSGMKRTPGNSWIEVNNVVHQFFAGDTSHPQNDRIYAKLDELGKQLESQGYLPNTNHVVCDIEEEEKERLTYFHSEKIAVAFGLISTAKGSYIRIVKNLRYYHYKQQYQYEQYYYLLRPSSDRVLLDSVLAGSSAAGWGLSRTGVSVILLLSMPTAPILATDDPRKRDCLPPPCTKFSYALRVTVMSIGFLTELGRLAIASTKMTTLRVTTSYVAGSGKEKSVTYSSREI